MWESCRVRRCRNPARQSTRSQILRHTGGSRCKPWWKSQKIPGQSQRSHPGGEQQEDGFEETTSEVRGSHHRQGRCQFRSWQSQGGEGNAQTNFQERSIQPSWIYQLYGQISAQTIRSNTAVERPDPGQSPICMVWTTWQSFKEMKKLILSLPVLEFYDVREEVTIQCDASQRDLDGGLL